MLRAMEWHRTPSRLFIGFVKQLSRDMKKPKEY